MKTILASVFSAVIAGLVLFAAQTWWAENQIASKQSIRFDQVATLDLTKSQLQELFEKSNQFQSTNIVLYKSRNIGTDDIENTSFSGPTSDVVSFGSINYPNGNPKNASMMFDGKVVSVKYKLLPPKTEHTFWVASSFSSFGVDFSNDSKGVHVLSSSEKSDGDVPFPWGVLGLIALSAVSLLGGMGVGAAWVSSELKKRGVDADEILKQPAPATPSPPTP